MESVFSPPENQRDMQQKNVCAKLHQTSPQAVFRQLLVLKPTQDELNVFRRAENRFHGLGVWRSLMQLGAYVLLLHIPLII
jgi:hypothetical protein